MPVWGSSPPLHLMPILVLAIAGWWCGQRMVDCLALQVQTEVKQRVQSKLELYLVVPQLITQINRDVLRLQRLDLKHTDSREPYRLAQLAQFQAANNILIGTEQGLLRAVNRQNSQNRFYWQALNLDRLKIQPGQSHTHSKFSGYQATSRAQRSVWSILTAKQPPIFHQNVRRRFIRVISHRNAGLNWLIVVVVPGDLIA